MNGDGKLDLALTNQGSNNVSVLLGNGMGGFSPAPGSPVAAGSGSYGLVGGDFNGDGKLDLAVTNGIDGTVSVFVGNGDGTFTDSPGSPIMVGAGPGGIATGDFNGDGRPDVAVVNFASNNANVLLNTSVFPFTLSPAMLPAATVGAPFSQMFTASGGAVGPYTLGVAMGSALPPGLTLMGSTLNGTPIAAGSFSFTLTVTDSMSNTGSQMFTLNVGKASTTTMVTSGFNPSTFGFPVTFTATVTSTVMGVAPTGTVTFTSGGMMLGAVPMMLNGMGMATLTANSLPVGMDPVVATYSGDANFMGSTFTLTQTVNKATPVVVVTGSPNPSVAGQSITVTAVVSGIGLVVPTGTVTFTSGAMTLGMGTLNSNGSTSIVSGALPAGFNSITAVYSGDANFNGSMGGTIQMVNRPVTFAVTAATGPGSNNQGTDTNPIISAGANLNLTATPNTGGASYTTSNANVAVVNASTGVVMGISPGTATITASGPNGTATITVTVTAGTGAGLTNPNAQPMSHAGTTASPATPEPQPGNHPAGGNAQPQAVPGTHPVGGGAQPQAVNGTPIATPQSQPMRH